MTEVKAVAENVSPDPAEDEEDLPQPEVDGILQMMVKLVNEFEDKWTIPVTLVFGGGIVSGNVISRQKYLKLMADVLKMPSIASIPGPTDAGKRPPPAFIHLEDARLWNQPAAPMPTTKGPGVVWRGRLTQITGWSLGTLEIEQPT